MPVPSTPSEFGEAVAQLVLHDPTPDEIHRARLTVCDLGTGPVDLTDPEAVKTAAADAADLMLIVGIHHRQPRIRTSAYVRKALGRSAVA
jgi:hypothetical protein